MKSVTKLIAVALLPLLAFLSCDSAKLSLMLHDGTTAYLPNGSITVGYVSTYSDSRDYTFNLVNVGENQITFTATPSLVFQNQVFDYSGADAPDTQERFTIVDQPALTYIDPGTTAEINIQLASLDHSTSGLDEGDATADLYIQAEVNGNPVDFTYHFYGLVC